MFIDEAGLPSELSGTKIGGQEAWTREHEHLAYPKCFMSLQTTPDSLPFMGHITATDPASTGRALTEYLRVKRETGLGISTAAFTRTAGWGLDWSFPHVFNRI